MQIFWAIHAHQEIQMCTLPCIDEDRRQWPFAATCNEMKQFEVARNLSYRVRVNRVKTTEKWGEIQRKWHLVRVCRVVPVIQV